MQTPTYTHICFATGISTLLMLKPEKKYRNIYINRQVLGGYLLKVKDLLKFCLDLNSLM